MGKAKFDGFPEDLFRFLKELSRNNNREWFNANRYRYETSVVVPVTEFIIAMGNRLQKISPKFVADPRTNGGSMFRIYRDTRFSKDKRPYKENVGCHFRHAAAKDAHGLGFYLHIQPGGSFAGAGIWAPPTPVLNVIRTAITERPADWKKVVTDRRLAARYGGIEGDSLKRVPKGFDEGHPYAEDLKRKSFFVMQEISAADAMSPKITDIVAQAYLDASVLMRFLARALDLPY